MGEIPGLLTRVGETSNLEHAPGRDASFVEMLSLAGAPRSEHAPPIELRGSQLEPNFKTSQLDESAPNTDLDLLKAAVMSAQSLDSFYESVYQDTKSLNRTLHQAKGFVAEDGFEHDMVELRKTMTNTGDTTADQLVFEIAVKDEEFNLSWK